MKKTIVVTSYGPCHLCGSETPERHGSIEIGCWCGEGAEICAECHGTAQFCPWPAESLAAALNDQIRTGYPDSEAEAAEEWSQSNAAGGIDWPKTDAHAQTFPGSAVYYLACPGDLRVEFDEQTRRWR